MNPLDPLLRRAATADADDISVDYALEDGSSWTKRIRKSDAEHDGCGWACCEKLTYTERLLGCGICLTGGYIFSFGSLLRFSSLVTGNPLPFAATWTLGNMLALCGAAFLVGFKEQMNTMLHPARQGAGVAYLGSMVISLAIVFICVLLNRPTGLILGFSLVAMLIVQSISIAWYTLSFVPMIRDYVSKLVFGEDDVGLGKKHTYEEII